jgi:hypothetical protein
MEMPESSRDERPAVKWPAVLAVTSLLAFMLAVVFIMGEKNVGAGSTVAGANSGAASFPFVGQVAPGSKAEGEDGASANHPRVAICHRTHNPHRPFIEIRVPQHTVPHHLQHGDIYPVPPGGCPRHVPSPMPTGVPTGVPTHIPTHIPTHVSTPPAPKH